MICFKKKCPPEVVPGKYTNVYVEDRVGIMISAKKVIPNLKKKCLQFQMISVISIIGGSGSKRDWFLAGRWIPLRFCKGQKQQRGASLKLGRT